MWNLHTWSTNEFASTFNLSGRVSVALHSQTVDAIAGRGLICATLIDRSTSAGIPTDTVIGTTTYDNASWPTSPSALTFTWDLPSAANLAADHRLLLVLSVRGESDADLDFLYDHPTYPSYLQVETTTPLP